MAPVDFNILITKKCHTGMCQVVVLRKSQPAAPGVELRRHFSALNCQDGKKY